MKKRFNRYELKYIIHVFQKKALTFDLRNYMKIDDNGDKNGYYPIESLYYDSPDFSFYRSKIEGIRFRRKVRIRTYPGNGKSPIIEGMVEIKQRVNKTVQKKRIPLPISRAIDLCNGDFDMSDLSGQDFEAASEIMYIAKTMQIRPTCMISYIRQAFVGSNYEPGLRITFDTSLKCRNHALEINGKAKNHHFMSPSWCIMEVKVDGFIPTWVNSLLAKHKCSLNRISKYCTGIEKSNSIKIMKYGS